MDLQEKLSLLEETFDCDEGFLKPEMVLAETGKWDSMAKLSLIVLIDDEFGKKLPGDVVRGFVTVQDILDVME